MSYGFSRFYSNVVQSFKSGNYDNGLKALMSYRVYRTTAASFRKIYNMIVPVLDKIISSSTSSGVIDQYQRALFRLNVILEYQKNRGVIDEDLANGIKQALDEIRNARDPQQARRLAETLRDSLDAFLAYVIYSSKRGEEEWL
ncbi:type III-A CRISPR-associated protein Csm2 [Vulcanisaeta sp. JCM 14467]|uniref:type III-A CRISPR-associated protein Csm2 n=1 Tax=Vulcanisaeta sp. JCM 14467 TaxID=1295370 RepID=UPI0006CF41EC|nr:type III-A CRISPR-associated protein Csm2 [Vulcanisaeta sp. JCM 14467]